MEEETKHFKNIVSTFLNYFSYGQHWINDMEDFYTNSLSDKHKVAALRLAVTGNSNFLKMIANDCNNVFHSSDTIIPTVDSVDSLKKIDIDYHLMDNLKSTLRQLVREWSIEGQVERDLTFNPIKEQLEELYSTIPNQERGSIKVYCPGAGLGRLCLDIASMGFSCQGIEYSYLMLICSSFILNKTSKINEFTIYPFIHQTVNVLQDTDQLRPIKIPDILPQDVLPKNPNQDFSMAAGDFTKNIIPDYWNVVCTCFFIDTARNILEYVDCISTTLVKGGYWINFGPLLYHYSDKKDSIELSYEQLRYVILQSGFTLLKEELRETEYTSNKKSLLKNVYKCQFFVAVKN
eukprot:gene1397-1766_t